MTSNNQIDNVVHDIITNIAAFRRLTASDLTNILRRHAVSNARLGANIRKDIEKALLDKGYVCFPPLANVLEVGSTRVYRIGTIAHDFVRILLNPGRPTDQELAGMITKVKRGTRPSTKGAIERQLRADCARQSDGTTAAQFVRALTEADLSFDDGCGHLALAEMLHWSRPRAKRAFEDAWETGILSRSVG